MQRDFLQELGEKIRIVEEVETYEYGECIGEFIRIRISIDITQPLEKILFLKQEGDADIPMPVVYERLPDFFFSVVELLATSSRSVLSTRVNEKRNSHMGCG